MRSSPKPWVIGVLALIAIVSLGVYNGRERVPDGGDARATPQDSREGPSPAVDPAPLAAIEPAAGQTAAPTQSAAVPPAAITTEAVVQAQRDLARLGFDAGKPDGVIGKKTRAAITAFQKAKGLPVDGELTPAVAAALKTAR